MHDDDLRKAYQRLRALYGEAVFAEAEETLFFDPRIAAFVLNDGDDLGQGLLLKEKPVMQRLVAVSKAFSLAADPAPEVSAKDYRQSVIDSAGEFDKDKTIVRNAMMSVEEHAGHLRLKLPS